jgi:hypothetical protein
LIDFCEAGRRDNAEVIEDEDASRFFARLRRGTQLQCDKDCGHNQNP